MLQNDRAAWICGPGACCSVPAAELMHPWRIVLLGAPGVGKGTQAQLLETRLGACQLSTGDVFRAAKAADKELSPAMQVAVTCMKAGRLVPDVTVLDMVRERTKCLRCGKGFILDGFPRTVLQAEALEQLLEEQGVALDAVLDLVLPLEEIVARLSGRRSCPGCKAVYHVMHRPPVKEGVCDACGKALVQREDDRPESVRVRMKAYQESTLPVTQYYRLRNLLLPVSATGTPEEICARAVGALEEARCARR